MKTTFTNGSSVFVIEFAGGYLRWKCRTSHETEVVSMGATLFRSRVEAEAFALAAGFFNGGNVRECRTEVGTTEKSRMEVRDKETGQLVGSLH